ncbi:MAG: hypothetical protein QOH95_2483 [Gaiellaceae bacterium]|nr:hypothetical protein [Gaiellaceae bacterium]
MARIGSKAVLVLVAVLALAANASAASPDVAAMNLQEADVPGARLVNQNALTVPGYLAAHVRSFVFTAPNSGSRLIELDSATALAASSAKVAADVAGAEKPLRSKASRKAVVAALAKGAKVKLKAVSFGQPHSVAGFDQGFEIAISLPVKGKRLYENLVNLRLDRVRVEMLEVSSHPIGAATTRKYAALIAAHIGTELAPIAVTPPTVAGPAQQGQTLTATTGSWTATDAAATYQWQRCDSAGANCVDVAGATAVTYAVTPADVGATLHVLEKATNRFGTATAPSAPTSVVS